MPPAPNDTNKEAPRRISRLPKVAATYSPRSVVPLIGKSGLRLEGHMLRSYSLLTPQCSTIGDAVSLSALSAPSLSLRPLSLCALSLPCALAPLRSAVSRLCPLQSLSRARAPQARTAHTPHGSLRAHTAPHSATPPPMRHTYQHQNLPIPPDYIKYMVSLK